MLRLLLALLFVGITAMAQVIADLPEPSQAQGNCVEAGGVPQSPPKPATFSRQDYVELSRSSCFGRCPAYRVRIYRSGQVEWEGLHFVKQVGASKSQAKTSDTAEIFKQAASTKFWAACDSYSRMVVDVPKYTVASRIGGESKSIEDYAYSGPLAPAWVREMMRRIDQAAESEKWVGSDMRRPIEVK